VKTKIKLNKQQIKELERVINNKESTTSEVRRCQTLLLMDEGVKQTVISRTTNYGRRHCFFLKRQYLANGITALRDKRHSKPKELLTKAQREEIITTLKTKTPKDCGYDDDYWSTSLLGYHIEKTYEAKYKSRTSHYLLFKKASFTFHKPGQVYQKHNEQEVREWEKANRERIEKAYKDKDTVILCEDEMVLSTKTTFQKIWLPKGEYPKILVSNKKEARSIYGFLNIKTGVEHAFKTEWQNMFITVEVLRKLRQIYQTEKILLLWDGPGSHRGSEVTKFLIQDKNIEVIYFPRYSPEQNPQEHVWREGRKEVTHNKYIEKIDTTTDSFVSYLNTTKFNYTLPILSAI
jgi:transposase